MKQAVVFCWVLSLLLLVVPASADRQFKLLERSISILTKSFEKTLTKELEEQAADGIKDNVDNIVQLYVGLHEQLTGKRVTDARKALVKDALYTGLERYRKDYIGRIDVGQGIRSVRDLANNRELMIYMLTNEEPEPILTQRILLYFTRKTGQPYTDPVNISGFVVYEEPVPGDVSIKNTTFSLM